MILKCVLKYLFLQLYVISFLKEYPIKNIGVEWVLLSTLEVNNGLEEDRNETSSHVCYFLG